MINLPLDLISYLGEHLKMDLADVELRVWVQTFYSELLSLQDRLGRPFDKQSTCMETENTDPLSSVGSSRTSSCRTQQTTINMIVKKEPVNYGG